MFIKPIAESIWWERIFVWPDSHVGKMKEIIVDTTKLLNNDNNASLFIQMLTTISNVDAGYHLTTLARAWDKNTMYHRRYEHGKAMVDWMRSEVSMGEVRGNEIAFEETVELGQGVEGEDTYVEQETWEG
ncbi:hypothetical protein TREMEDRAFT_64773 [Tremella mesenterica DSM 1558]|uniref:uncharacterized protein n=1 Tax=Tremella mesenterica (strain ATCC 24925 / CBS 8224 / DSM 1558 / NBRC 9311 / NRRL Y-6157 / RJB 2259-6 / UBC 559-6) TaxID=578456 RepID=UPI0003F49051|nr:uncharacterized protein TREMEDRAFT_64773 [Tremella mesenterica DSM 1558]EIW66919.1 hypothetical protein TREMEDRAFT_64773 [Tremella mesenterica DSM 1558]